MEIADRKFVSFEYRLTDDQGELIDSSGDNEPITYIHGMGQIVPGLEAALEGRQAGEQFEVRLDPEQGYGPYYDELCGEIAREEFEDVDEIEVGMQFSMLNEDDEEVVVSVVDFDETSVTVDGNHPLAGVPLNFDITIHDVRNATAEEIAASEAHHCDDDECGCDDED